LSPGSVKVIGLTGPFDAKVIGLTGPFGSGCSTAADLLVHERGYRAKKLSDVLRDGLAEAGELNPSRARLQAAGDVERKVSGESVLVDKALAQLYQLPDDVQLLVLDGIRNLGEVDALKRNFGYRFCLIAVAADAESRWDRVKGDYRRAGLARADFVDDDNRDRGGRGRFGQQVGRCVDEADGVVINDEEVPRKDFENRLLALSDVLTNKVNRSANADEIAMHQAFSTSHSSKCLRRYVGAVIVNDRNEVVGTGYNENPYGSRPCVEEPEYNYSCFRDIVRRSGYESLAKEGIVCPVCAAKLRVSDGPPFYCLNCRDRETLTSLDRYFFPDRALTWCTAVHAEDRALLLSRGCAKDAIMFTTTFPCFQCAEKIVEAGIREVVFVEAYPDPHSAKRLHLAGVIVRQFEGVRSSAFERVFTRPR
jgi:deoxycytidylate deaminase